MLPGTSDIDNEALWGILEQREEARRTAEWRRLGEVQVLRALEAQKLHQDKVEQDKAAGNQ
jgi:hypothetical protein